MDPTASNSTGTIEATIERLVASGAGLARVDGRVVFVQGAIPCDRVRARIVRAAKRHAEAVVVEILEPSVDRRAPRCSHFGACGGCALQHIAYPAQLAAKRGLLLDALRSVAGFVPDFEIDIVGSPEYGWRSRAEFQVVRAGAGLAPGCFRVRSHDVEAVRECPVLVPELETFVRELAAGVRAIPESAHTIHAAAGDADAALVFADESGRTVGADSDVTHDLDGLRVAADARGFFQANRPLLRELVERATKGVPGSIAFDLYAGAGTFSLPLARRFDLVMAVEEDARAVEHLRANAVRAGRTGIQAHTSDVSQWLALGRKLGPEFVLLDPPRSGAGPVVVDVLAAIAPPEIRYVSCDPATLARDLRGFIDQGYRVESLALFDLFPQTLHVETVAVLRPAGV